jgi:hypothetical protein
MYITSRHKIRHYDDETGLFAIVIVDCENKYINQRVFNNSDVKQ